MADVGAGKISRAGQAGSIEFQGRRANSKFGRRTSHSKLPLMRVSIRNLTKRFGAVTALKSISLEIGDQELFFLLGPSGCGKTTLLRTIAGFYQPDDGDLLFGERSMRGVPAHQRNAGMVFQNYALWPHMTVEQNVA